MSYILMEESLFRLLMGRILNQATDVNYRFSETDYWMNGKSIYLSSLLIKKLDKLFFSI